MEIFPVQRVLIAVLLVVTPMLSVRAQDVEKQQHLEVSMRMIGHRLLLSSGDTVSRVLPIEHKNDTYKIVFDSELEVHPDSLVAIVKDVLNHAHIYGDYFVELEKCETKEVAYSFEVAKHQKNNIVPCSGRVQPRGCYSILITLNSSDDTVTMNPTSIQAEQKIKSTTFSLTPWLILGVLILSIVGIFIAYQKRPESNPNLPKLGSFLFDRKNTTLILDDTVIELTGKEAELLILLHESVNEIVNRNAILNKVWGDDGDYVGRTLDVFISKLRKKLELDPKVKIVNVRGVGYKLVVNA